jgi:hypothetical protein
MREYGNRPYIWGRSSIKCPLDIFEFTITFIVPSRRRDRFTRTSRAPYGRVYWAPSECGRAKLRSAL